ncbi:hypothetical protein Slin15195_G080030 [Septoria linicola]|uniref:Uncharacterized protein n=1 Tax=Septoria linicola TaxID=215465 RepID=A0A9Q9ATX2_9PEZI|nr:hypothetical protein Slin15195_G080030 [Septoria linicola]
MATTTRDPAFKRLSAELRNKIYELVLYHGRITIDSTYVNGDSRVYRSGLQGIKRSHPLAITTVCKQIRLETMKMFFGINTFAFADNYGESFDSAIHKFASHIGEENFSLAGPLSVEIDFDFDVERSNAQMVFSLHMPFMIEALKMAQRPQSMKLEVATFESRLGHRDGTNMLLDVSSTAALLRSACMYYYHTWPGGSGMMRRIESVFGSAMLRALNVPELEAIDQDAIALEKERSGCDIILQKPTLIDFVLEMPKDGYLGAG